MIKPEDYFGVVRRLDLSGYRAGVETDALVIARSGDLTVEYAPFDHVEDGAELVIVGLTPGRQQAANALEVLAAELSAGVPAGAALAKAKRTASFSGPMRASLVAMLDEIGVPALYGRSSAAEFFGGGPARVHMTSAIRYPVYLKGRNYSGAPNPLVQPMLAQMIDTHLAEEAQRLRAAVWVPLGVHAESALLRLSSLGKLPRENILAGLPHPSGANAERISYFLGRKPRAALSAKTNAERIDRAKRALLEQVDALRRPHSSPRGLRA